MQCFGQLGFVGFLFLIQVVFLSKITDPIGTDFLLKHKKKRPQKSIGRQE